MNSLKNLFIIAVLAAVGYGIYVSLQHNSEPNQNGGLAQDWPTAPTVELPAASAATPSPASSPLASAASSPSNTAGLGIGGTPATPSNLATSLPAAMPYPSSSVPSVAVPGAVPSATLLAAPPAASNPASPATSSAISQPPVAPFVAENPSISAANNQPLVTTTVGQTASSHSAANVNPPSNTIAAAAPSATQKAMQTDVVFLSKFNAFMEAVQKKLDEGKLAEAHLALSTLRGKAELPPEQEKQINALLDQLAGTVVYSREHFLEKPYLVQPNDTLEKIAQKFNVPWQLLGRINGLLPPYDMYVDNETKDRLLPDGFQMKVVSGPFDAVVDLKRHELTLLLPERQGQQQRYAGRFAIGVGRDQNGLEGIYTVRDKPAAIPSLGPDAANAAAGNFQAAMNSTRIGLTDRIGIQSTNDSQSIGRDDNSSSICVSNRDFQDLCGILSVGSRVTILR